MREGTCRHVSARALAPRRLSSRDEDVVHLREFHTVKDAEGSYQSTLHLTDKGRLLHPYLWDKTDFEGEKRASKKEADDSAAKVFWDDPHVLDIARKLWDLQRRLRESTATGFWKI